MYSECCIGLCVYNNEFGLPFVLKNIKKLEPLFHKLTIIVFYDNSTDKSMEILEQYKTTFKESIVILHLSTSEHDNSNKKKSRTERIAFARNNILNYIRTNHSTSEYFIMMDSNEYSCVGDLNTTIFQEVMDKNTLWDAVSFDREAGYYDIWALSFDPYIYSFFHFIHWQMVVAKMRESFNNILRECKEKMPEGFIPVFSAFNGFAIYKTSYFLNCDYSSNIDLSLFSYNSIVKETIITGKKIVNYFANDCEHRHFHLEAIKKNNARIRIYPKSLFAKFQGKLPPNCRGPA